MVNEMVWKFGKDAFVLCSVVAAAIILVAHLRSNPFEYEGEFRCVAYGTS